MITATIADFCGIDASFPIGEPLTLICGPNGAGKTRIAEAIGAVFSSTATPLTGRASDKKEIVGESGRASVRIDCGDAMGAMIWPEGEASMKGDQKKLPNASVWAAGLRHPLDLTGKERAQAFADIFRTEPTRRNLEDALAKRDLLDHLEGVWSTVEISGWGAAAKEAADNARSLKGAWGEVTGATWGERVGAAWEPGDAKFPDEAGLREELEMRVTNLKTAREELERAKEARTALPQTPDAEALACPHCGGYLSWRQGEIIKAEPVDPGKIRETRLAIAGADGDLSRAQRLISESERAMGAAQARLNDASEARQKAQERAAELHGQIMRQLEIASVCGPQGLRKAKLEHVLSKVNASLAELAEKIGLPIVEVDAELEATMDGTPYRQLSRAESYLARTILQIEIARRDGSTMVVVDDLDVPIDPQDRNKVLYALHGSGLMAVVMLAARAPEPRLAPDISQAGPGWEKCLTYWIDRRHGLRPIAEAKLERAA